MSHPKHILLVEPDLRLAGVYAQWLRAAGYGVAARTTAQAAISAADEQRPDLVLLELQLTNHGGVEFLYEFRSYTDWQRIPVIVLSAVPERAFAGSRQLLRQRLGVKEYYYKPAVSLQTLRGAVDGVLGVAA